MTRKPFTYFFFFVMLVAVGCNPAEEDAKVTGVDVYLDPSGEKINGKSFALDYTHTIDSGFVFPSLAQSADGNLHLNIQVEELKKDKKYYYKVYYQNESYKFDELEDKEELVNENFYGSWEDPGIGFMEIDRTIVEKGKGTLATTLKIHGNPRNEIIYYGETKLVLTEEEIQKKANGISTFPNWMAAIKEKAEKENRTIEEQLRMDAIYTLETEFKESNSKKQNVRAGRNLRTGNYSILVVVLDQEQLSRVPQTVRNISLQADGKFKNPYQYFLKDREDPSLQTCVYKSSKAFTLKAKVDFSKGIYIPEEFAPQGYSKEALRNNCSTSQHMRENAQIEQFFQGVIASENLNNIPLVADVMDDSYSKDVYKQNAKKYSDAERVKIPVKVSDCPCKTVQTDSLNNTLIMTNPASTPEKMKKENVGIITRHPMTYGKYTVKIKMTEQMNKHNVWNGLTNAIWLIYRGVPSANQRRICGNNGYIPKHLSGKDAKREPTWDYSEIDFEIVKCAQYWPKSSYKNTGNYKREEKKNAPNVMVTCTNWDLGCDDVAEYIVGAVAKKIGKNTYEFHRWDYWGQALTTKTPANEDELFASPYYFFQIEWKPKEIIWRIGPEKNKLREVARMSDKITQIPNNQMVMVITQEYHLTHWWPEAPFEQDNVPFPSKESKGTVFSIEIE